MPLITIFPPKVAKVGKYDQHIKEFLLKNGKLSAEKIGTFLLSRFSTDDKAIQPQLIDFKFNRKEQTSEELIDFIVKETGKNKTLVSSDIASFFEGARQYINIGKPFSLVGLGTLVLGKNGEYEFRPTQGAATLQEGATDSTAKTVKTVRQVATQKQARRNLVMVFALVIVILIVAGAGWGVYKYVGQKKIANSNTPANTNDADTTKTANTTVPVAKAADSVYYKFIFEATPSKYRAHARYDSLKSWGEHVFIDSIGTDSNIVYHLYVRAKVTNKDTSYIKDSIQRYFHRPGAVTVAGN